MIKPLPPLTRSHLCCPFRQPPCASFQSAPCGPKRPFHLTGTASNVTNRPRLHNLQTPVCKLSLPGQASDVANRQYHSTWKTDSRIGLSIEIKPLPPLTRSPFRLTGTASDAANWPRLHNLQTPVCKLSLPGQTSNVANRLYAYLAG